jgi:hypothetical protein
MLHTNQETTFTPFKCSQCLRQLEPVDQAVAVRVNAAKELP